MACLFFDGYPLGDNSAWSEVGNGGITVQDDVVHSGIYAGKLEGYGRATLFGSSGSGATSITPAVRAYYVVDALPSARRVLGSWGAVGTVTLETDGTIGLGLVTTPTVFSGAITPGQDVRVDYAVCPMSGTANAAVTVNFGGAGTGTLVDTRRTTGPLAWVVNEHAAAVFTYNAKTLTVASNTADTLTGTWNADPGAGGLLYTVGDGLTGRFVARINAGTPLTTGIAAGAGAAYSYWYLGGYPVQDLWADDAANCYCDDVYACDDGWPPIGQCSGRNLPASDSATYNEWPTTEPAQGAGEKHECVHEAVVDDATSYVSPNANNQRQTFIHDQAGGYGAATSINAVVVWTRGNLLRKTALYSPDASVVYSSPYTSGWTWGRPLFAALDPHTGAAWIDQGVDDLQGGAWGYTSGGASQLSHVDILVDFAPTGTWTGIALGKSQVIMF